MILKCQKLNCPSIKIKTRANLWGIRGHVWSNDLGIHYWDEFERLEKFFRKMMLKWYLKPMVKQLNLLGLGLFEEAW